MSIRIIGRSGTMVPQQEYPAYFAEDSMTPLQRSTWGYLRCLFCITAVLFAVVGCETPEQAKFYEESANRLNDDYLPKARAGDKQAQFDACWEFYLRARKVAAVETNLNPASHWCAEAARSGYASAAYLMGEILYLDKYHRCDCRVGLGGHEARERVALQWYELAERLGDKDAPGRIAEVKEDLRKDAEPSSSGKIVAGVIGAAVMSKAPNLSAAERARMTSGLVSDIATDGGGRGITSAADDIRSARAAQSQSTSRAGGATNIASSSSTSGESKGPYIRVKSFEPDPYESQGFKWLPFEDSHDAIFKNRAAACQWVKGGLHAYMQKMSAVSRLEEETPCVCAVNAGYNRDVHQSDARWDTDHHTCKVYYRTTQIGGGSKSK
ncbi:hypothetical protein ACPWT1_06570 [Ramlibacter sp. MMS24-I3-19]|uniref:hypothetical protein n=1 Tax=Ramlibacter sp. MMS24-I3-19 TaxID=3416606 RepID=UPI003CFE9A4F